ncbi:hypothetical protein chiPu_0014521 [Chiloscyllium punctatum]|uniref:Uncharacterized protein n=1 Tax=Chiloscyllium punctatum TaxID=137246 RepID=A0A401T066_CHIPU|nr:hypothetical protein [Chiloscyllium punctatum]
MTGDTPRAAPSCAVIGCKAGLQSQWAAACPGASHLAGIKMAAGGGYLLLLTCLVGQLPLGHPRKVPQFPGGEQLKSNQLQLRRKRYNSHALYSVGDENRLKNEDAVAGHKEYYLPRPPPRMHPHVYEGAKKFLVISMQRCIHSL